jgi:hypothetical protein
MTSLQQPEQHRNNIEQSLKRKRIEKSSTHTHKKPKAISLMWFDFIVVFIEKGV